MKGSNFDKQFSDEALPPIQDLSKHYNPTIKQSNESTKFENFDS